MEGTVTRTYRLRPETVERLNALADGLQLLSRSELVDFLLIEGIEMVEAGRWEVRTHPTRARLAGLVKRE